MSQCYDLSLAAMLQHHPLFVGLERSLAARRSSSGRGRHDMGTLFMHHIRSLQEPPYSHQPATLRANRPGEPGHSLENPEVVVDSDDEVQVASTSLSLSASSSSSASTSSSTSSSARNSHQLFDLIYGDDDSTGEFDWTPPGISY